VSDGADKFLVNDGKRLLRNNHLLRWSNYSVLFKYFRTRLTFENHVGLCLYREEVLQLA
jgi:hypothetical protein